MMQQLRSTCARRQERRIGFRRRSGLSDSVVTAAVVAVTVAALSATGFYVHGTSTTVQSEPEGSLSDGSVTMMGASGNLPPVITSFTADETMSNWWKLSGTVDDESVSQCTVTFSGQVVDSVNVDMYGTFELNVELDSSEWGDVHAQATDGEGLESDVETVYVGY